MYSSAFNNIQHLSGMADPQTGLYSFSYVFGSLISDAGFGPQCDLTVSFNALSALRVANGSPNNVTGLGSGWSFRLSSYSKNSQSITLTSGETYNVLFASHNGPWELSHKVKDIRVEQKEAEIFVYHKNGAMEVLSIDDSTGNGSISRYVAPSGRYIAFNYSQKGGVNRLTEVYDRVATLATVSYSDDELLVTITLFPNADEQRIISLNIQSDGKLYKIELPESQAINLAYEDHGYSQGQTFLPLLKAISYPTGAMEEMEYLDKLYLPDGAPIPYMPAITQHIKTVSSQQPAIVTKLSYETAENDQPSNNFWGYNSGVNWQDNMDNLYDYPSTYYYTSATHVGDKYCAYRYNKLHQLIESIETNGDDNYKKITRLTYFSDDSATLEAQDNRYELLKRQTTCFEVSATEVSPDFIKSYDYDEWGNILTEEDVSGVRTVNTYYTLEGEEGCPAHPYALVGFIKSKTLHANDDTESKVVDYTYKAISDVNANPNVYLVLARQYYKQYSRIYDYFAESSKIDTLSELKSETLVVGNKEMTTSYGYIFGLDDVFETTTVESHDGLINNSSIRSSLWSGRLLSETNADKVTTQYTYDTSGRVKTQTDAVGSDYELLTTISYDNNPKTPAGEAVIGTCVVTETQGVANNRYYDAEQKALYAYQQDEHGLLYKVSASEYDDQGRLVSEAGFDYEFSAGSSKVDATYSNLARYYYGIWGEVCETTHHDGTIEMHSIDPINLQMRQQIIRRDDTTDPEKVTSALASTVTYFDLFGNPTLNQVISLSDEVYSESASQYDGFGRKVSITTPKGSRASIDEYDAFDRPTHTSHFDGTPHIATYHGLSAGQQVTNISAQLIKNNTMTDISLGEQAFDGLNRISSRCVNGVTKLYEYAENSLVPTRVINGREQSTTIGHIPELGKPSRIETFANAMVVASIEEGSLSKAEFTFVTKATQGVPTGRLSNAKNNNGRYDFTYSETGRMKTVKQTVSGKTASVVSTEQYLLSGQTLAIKVGARSLRVELDKWGRVVASSDGNVRTETQWDTFNRVEWVAIYQSGELRQNTAISYDDYSREISRTITISKMDESIVIDCEYDNESKLIKRVTCVNDSASLSEHYEYDSRKRLISYFLDEAYADVLLPCNEWGKAIIGQTFAYDGLNNLTALTTIFPNGDSDTATYSYDVQRVTGITHTLTCGHNAYPGNVKLSYDNDGNIIRIEGNEITTLAYTVSNQVSQCNDTGYRYDAFNRVQSTGATDRYYLGNRVISEVAGDSQCHLIRHGKLPIAEIQDGNTKLLATDNRLSVIGVTHEDKP